MAFRWFARPSVAIAFGAFMLCAETCDHFDAIRHGDWLNMPIHDWTAGALLVVAGVRNRRALPRQRILQAVAWAFMLSLLFGAFFAHLSESFAPTDADDWISMRVVFPILIALNVIALGALVGTVRREQ